MGWNDSGNKDPWGSRQQPPDLEEALKKLQRQIKSLFLGKGRFGKIKAPVDASPQGFFGAGLLLILGLLWILSGIFIVNPAEQAVILRLGKYVETVGPGPHWIPSLIYKKVITNVDRVADYSYSGQMLTRDENLVAVSIVVQYRIGDLSQYLFNVADPEESLRQATSSALRQVVGTTTLDQLITAGREIWGGQVQESLVKILARYQTGIQIISVAPQPARAPENVQSAFDDAIKAQEDERRFIEQARAYEAKVVPIAEGQAKRVLQEAEADAKQVVLAAEGETAEFLKLLPQYEQAPKVTAERMYIETMQNIMSQNPKVFVDAKNAPNMYMPFLKPGKGPAPAKVKVEQDWNDASTTAVTASNEDNDTRARINVLRTMRRTTP